MQSVQSWDPFKALPPSTRGTLRQGALKPSVEPAFIISPLMEDALKFFKRAQMHKVGDLQNEYPHQHSALCERLHQDRIDSM